jgi:hypothetical protein
MIECIAFQFIRLNKASGFTADYLEYVEQFGIRVYVASTFFSIYLPGYTALVRSKTLAADPRLRYEALFRQIQKRIAAFNKDNEAKKNQV